MARVFISFAVEDCSLRNLLVGQKRNARNQIDFTDYSVKDPWSSSWKTNCRERIKQCRGFIAIITRNTPNAAGQLWEVSCTLDEGVPSLFIHGHPDANSRIVRLPHELEGLQILSWTEVNVVNFLNQLG